MFSGLSVIITYYNDPEIKNCIDSIVESQKSLIESQKKQIEFIVVDDDSPQPYNYFPEEIEIQYIHQEKNQGVGSSRNLGAKKAQYSHILFVDADVLLSVNYFKQLFDILSKNNDLKVIQYPHHYVAANHPLSLFHKYLALSWYYNSTVTTIDEKGHPTLLISSCVCFNKNYFHSIGGFKTNYSGSGGEEFEITNRIPQGTMTYNQKLESYNYFDNLLPRLKKLLSRSKNYSQAVGKNPNMLLKTKWIYALRALSMILLTSSLTFLFIDLKIGLICYLSLYALNLLIDFKITHFFLKKSDLITTLASVLYRQLEYTTISIGMGARLASLPFLKQNQALEGEID